MIKNSPQTDKEFYNYFQDVLTNQIKATCKSKDLVFLTLQPQQICLTPCSLNDYTAEVFKGVNYVEVKEQTFKVSKRYNTADYIDAWHSHLILSKDEYLQKKDALIGFDVKMKPVYDLARLKTYLAKQAMRNRLLPSCKLVN